MITSHRKGRQTEQKELPVCLAGQKSRGNDSNIYDWGGILVIFDLKQKADGEPAPDTASFYEDYFNKPYAFVPVRTSGDASQNENSLILTQNRAGVYVRGASQNHDALLHSALELLLLGNQKTQDGEKAYFKILSTSCSLFQELLARHCRGKRTCGGDVRLFCFHSKKQPRPSLFE